MKCKNNFTYKTQDSRYEQALISWYERKHSAVINKNYIVASPSIGNMYGICIFAFTSPGDKILIMTPVYDVYYQTGTNLER